MHRMMLVKHQLGSWRPGGGPMYPAAVTVAEAMNDSS